MTQERDELPILRGRQNRLKSQLRVDKGDNTMRTVDNVNGTYF